MGEKEFLSALNEFTIPEISEETKFWMIRTKKGYFMMNLLVEGL